jgi:hypothetical protein
MTDAAHLQLAVKGRVGGSTHRRHMGSGLWIGGYTLNSPRIRPIVSYGLGVPGEQPIRASELVGGQVDQLRRLVLVPGQGSRK